MIARPCPKTVCPKNRPKGEPCGCDLIVSMKLETSTTMSVHPINRGHAPIKVSHPLAAAPQSGAPPRPALQLCMGEALAAHRGVGVAVGSLGATVSCTVPGAGVLMVHALVDPTLPPQNYELREVRTGRLPRTLELGGDEPWTRRRSAMNPTHA